MGAWVRALADCGAQGRAHRAKQSERSWLDFAVCHEFCFAKLAKLGYSAQSWLVPVLGELFIQLQKSFISLYEMNSPPPLLPMFCGAKLG